MPTYCFRNKENGEEIEIILKIAELDQYKLDHPELETLIRPVQTVRGINKKPDNGFRDVLKSIKKASGENNTINTF